MREIDAAGLERFVKTNLLTDKNGKRDICPIYSKSAQLEDVIYYLAEPFRGNVDYVAAPESLGFILGSMLAEELKVGFIPIRDAEIAPLPDDDVVRSSYIDHNDNPRTLQIRRSNLPENSHILLVDDWIDTAITMQTCIAIMEEAECEVEGIAAFGVRSNTVTGKMLGEEFLRCVVVQD